MFLINNSLKGINLKRFKLVRLKYSKNIISVSAPQNIVAPARAYIITTQANDGHNVSIVLVFAKPQIKPIFFEFHKNPVSPKRAMSIEDDALSFVEDMGFEMHDMDLTTADAQTRTNEVIKKLGIFYYPHPTGAIDLQPAVESLVADGVSQMLVESQPIKDSDGDVIADGTSFEVKSSLGQIVNPMTQEKGNPLKIVSKSGFITFGLQAATEVGLATVQVLSKFGNAKGATRIIFIPGEPVSKIVLTASDTQLIADGVSTIMIQSNQIIDRTGNQIADGREFTVSCTQGAILDQETRQGGQEAKVIARGAVLRFLYRVDRIAGIVTIKVQSSSGTSIGELKIVLISGHPTGVISLEPTRKSVQVNDSGSVTITSGIITDESGNVVSDVALFHVSATLGMVQGATGRSSPELTLSPREGIISFAFFAGIKSGRARISIKAVEGEAEGSCFVKVLAALPTKSFRLLANPAELVADGKSVAVITPASQIVDDYGNIIENDTPFTVEAANGRLLGILKGNIVLTRDGLFSFEFLSATSGDTGHLTIRGPQDKPVSSIDLKLITLEPTGVIALTSTDYSLTANETDECEITSEVIVNSGGNPVVDETVIHFEVTLGEFISFDGSRLGTRLVARTTEGVVSVRIRVGRKRGTLHVRARSQTGSAQGELKIPIMAESPEGVINLLPEKNSLPADGKSRVWVTSAPVTDANENIVDDGTLISLEAERGKIITDKMTDASDPADDSCHVPTRNGIIRFQLQSDKRVGRTQVTALSVEGFAMGAMDIDFVGGPPHGTIELSPPTGEKIRAGGEPIRLMTGTIADMFGNTVSDEEKFNLSVEGGFVVADSAGTLMTSLVLSPREGVLSILFKPGERPNPAKVKVRSEEGDATGVLAIPLEPGFPAGSIDLETVGETHRVAGAIQPVSFQSAPIKDAFGNIIDDGQGFNVTVTPPVVLGDSYGSSSLKGEIYLESKDGRLFFNVKSTEPGIVRISVVPLHGKAEGGYTLEFNNPPPSGKIELRPENEILTADGESVTVIESSPVMNSLGHPVADGTQFTILVDNGFAFIDDQESAAAEVGLVSHNGRISFHVFSTPQPGMMTCNVASTEGDARGSCSIKLVPGQPAGTIVLLTSVLEAVAGSHESIAIETEVILDQYDNMVADGERFLAQVSGGELIPDDDPTGRPEKEVAVLKGKLVFSIRPGSSAGELTVSVVAQRGEARGDLSLAIVPAPSQECIEFESPDKELLADNMGLLELKSLEIRDIYGHLIPDNSRFTVSLTGGIGAADATQTLTPGFTVESRQGRISFLVQSPAESKTVSVSVQLLDNRAYGSIDLVYVRPQPSGEFELICPIGILHRAGIVDRVEMHSSRIMSDRGEPILDGERFIITCSAGELLDLKETAGESPGGMCQSIGGEIGFGIVLPVKSGQFQIEAHSVRGNAQAFLVITILPAAPAGLITLVAERTQCIAGDPSAFIVQSGEVKDRFENLVIDGCRFIVSINEGLLSAGESMTRRSEIEVSTMGGKLEFHVRSGLEPGTMKVLVRSVESDAAGELTLAVVPAPPEKDLEILLDQDEFLSDGASLIPVHSAPILDIYDNPLRDGHAFLVRIKGGIGVGGTAAEASDSFTLTSFNGRIGFEVLSPVISQSVDVEVSSTTADCKGRAILRFYRPESAGEISWKLPREKEFTLGTVDRIQFQSGPIFTNRDIPVLDGDEFLITCRGGSLSGEQPSTEAGDQLTIRSRNGEIAFAVNPPVHTGLLSVTAVAILGQARGSKELLFLAGPPMGEIVLDHAPDSLSAATANPIRVTTDFLTDASGHRISDQWQFAIAAVGGSIFRGGDSDASGDPLRSIVTLPENGRLHFRVLPDVDAAEMRLTIEAIDPIASARGDFSFAVIPPVPAGIIVLSGMMDQLPADGRATTTISSGSIFTTRGSKVADGEKFLVTCDRGSISAPLGEITEKGMILPATGSAVSFSLRTSKKAGSVHIRISSLLGDAQGELEVTFTPGDPSGNIKLMAEPLKILADGTTVTHITSESIADAGGNPIADGSIVFIETDLGEFPEQAESKRGKEPFSTSASSGKISVILKSSTQSGVASLVAWSQSGNAIGNLEIYMTPGPPSGDITLLPSAQEVPADGKGIAIITTLPVKDRFGNYISEQEEFSITIQPPESDERSFTTYPKNGKLEFETTPQESPGDVVISIASVNGDARGSIRLRYHPLVSQLDEEEEWFFAESEDDFLISDTSEPSVESESAPRERGDSDDLQLSIENSFSRLLSREENDVEEEDERRDQAEPLHLVKRRQKVAEFFNFLAGF